MPVYEPYFATFDLKTISAGGIDSVQVTRGPSSVLSGPNTLGGLINVITKRPAAQPCLSLTGSYGDRSTIGVGGDGSYAWRSFSLAASALYQASDGFNYPAGLRRRATPSEGQQRLQTAQPQRQALIHALQQDRDHDQRRDLPVGLRHAARAGRAEGPLLALPDRHFELGFRADVLK